MKYHLLLITAHNITFLNQLLMLCIFFSTDEYAMFKNINIYWLDHLRN